MKPARLRFAPDSAAGAALVQWWLELHERQRGERAALNRAESLESAVLSGDADALRAFHRLGDAIAAAARADEVPFRDYQAREDGSPRYNDRDRLWPIAVLLASIRPERNGGPGSGRSEALPRAMRRPGANREACVSEQRFKRLLALDTPAELLRPLRRVLALLAQAGHPVDLYDLAAALYRWDERRRKNWAYAYFARSDETARPDAAPVQP
ncbi:type I-E CRISPR-associated protein Cse2/CasB [Plasticicumulans sp.]|uniref:type I-E CRISPR-associated protein Cse2/CasB n=1 Tax=Plasticicumulans sp. TaxID=2307179 RepID=UPI002CE89AAE|nr:type I-E CRISPR-associated protein Cse2/CasB [Plasticicumulans sp.]MBS0601109.1 type I-E CRISPR-associated protein Cse2/CasB [Pseudomonadota bacterium]HMV38054.1 type I-E CRISPR-associated protein Cse2/CasB [Plasticicumulans sp.]HMZ10378.1 type I-E CRISPR-associated protein Cse2/CasB [Plasticicumulans sp.]HNG50448.1 type I-E CRISPR-associated protein Cse2/CasB [Plasticicumulans sp.]HNI22592.1 type I-E CRISPR-associated protein Cse2/CasB [Plasticicumulans sp.]